MQLIKKVDLVYLWVDGSDNNWLINKEYWKKQLISQPNTEEYDWTNANGIERFEDNNELKYSLRSVYLYAKWINNIYIITDNQKPLWLNTDHPKIHIVDHKDIMPSSILPCYNSTVIEHFVRNIKGLSEYFLLACDDHMFYKKTRKSFFYTLNGRLKYRPFSSYYDKENIIFKTYVRSVANGYNAIYKKFGKKYFYRVSHNMCPLKLSVVKNCYLDFKDLIDRCCTHKFRSFNDVHYAIYPQFACATGVGKLILEGQCLKDKIYFNSKLVRFIYEGLIRLFHRSSESKYKTEDNNRQKDFLVAKQDEYLFNSSTNITCNDKDDYVEDTRFWTKKRRKIVELQEPKNLEPLKAWRPHMFCINNFLPECKNRLISDLDELFPDKCVYER